MWAQDAYAKKAKDYELTIRDLNTEIIDMEEDKDFDWIDKDKTKKIPFRLQRLFSKTTLCLKGKLSIYSYQRY